MRSPSLVTIGSEVTATAALTVVPFADVKRATVEITSAGTFLNRSGVLTAAVSMDGTNYTTFNMLIPNVANSNAEQLTRVAATTAISTTGKSAIYTIDELTPFKDIKFTLTVTDGGTPTGNFTVKVYKQYA